MRRLTLPVLCFMILVTLAQPAAAAIHVGWRAHIGLRLRSVAVAPNGSIYVVGDRRHAITAEAILVKLAPDGRRLWTRSWLPNVDASTNGVAVDVMPNGNVVWTGIAQQQCEGNGWFVQVNGPMGRLIRRYVTPGWQCSLAETVTDIAARNDQIVVSGYTHGCCSDPFLDGWVQSLDATAHPTWRTNVEPPSPTPAAWFDRATGVALGAFGNIYVGGWAATAFIKDETSRTPGTITLWKLTSGGGVLWSKRAAGVALPNADAPVAVSARGDAVMVAAGVRGEGVRWHLGSSRPSDGWLGRFTTGGSLVWSRDWDTNKPRASEPAQDAIDGSGATWVVGTRRRLADKGLELFVRRYAAGGGLLDAAVLDGGVRFLQGTGIAARPGGGAYATGFVGQDVGKSGRLWRLTA